MNDSPAHREALATVASLIAEVVGEEWMFDRTITPATSFSADLELESIEFVALAERLQGRYGAGVDFAGWLSGMDLDRILALKVGDLVEFIVRCRS